jgi:hypothetical protein
MKDSHDTAWELSSFSRLDTHDRTKALGRYPVCRVSTRRQTSYRPMDR